MTLQRAAEVLGGAEPLARRLRVSPSRLALWMCDVEHAPIQIFLQAVDVVMEHDLGAAAQHPLVEKTTDRLSGRG
jgi:hypothetical protein